MGSEMCIRDRSTTRPSQNQPSHAAPTLREAQQTDKEERPDKWTQYDVERSLRSLRVGTTEQRSLTLRKLHIRWWHASAQQMQRILGRAGVPKACLDLIPSITHTCEVCQAWQRPGHANIATANLPDQFNHCLLYTSPSPRDLSTSRMPSSA